MVELLILVVVVLLLPVIYVVLTYNTLVALGNHIRDAWSNIDTELKRRYDLIPNLVATVKGYAAHEKEILERVTSLQAQPPDLGRGLISPATCGRGLEARPTSRPQTRTNWWTRCGSFWQLWRTTLNLKRTSIS